METNLPTPAPVAPAPERVDGREFPPEIEHLVTLITDNDRRDRDPDSYKFEELVRLQLRTWVKAEAHKAASLARDGANAGMLELVQELRKSSQQVDAELKHLKEKVDGELNAVKQQVEELARQKNAAYAFRQRLAAILARLYPSQVFTTTDGDFGEWSTCLYINLFGVQLSFHYHDSELWMLKGIERASTNPWDGSNAEQQTTALNELLLTSTAQQFRNSIVPE